MHHTGPPSHDIITRATVEYRSSHHANHSDHPTRLWCFDGDACMINAQLRGEVDVDIEIIVLSIVVQLALLV